MRQAVAALVSARALAARDEETSRGDAPPGAAPVTSAARRRRALTWAWLSSIWKAAHPGG
jgi:hypothetical protein